MIVKLLKEDYPTPAELYRYQQEYEITPRLNLQETIIAFLSNMRCSRGLRGLRGLRGPQLPAVCTSFY